MTKHLQIKHHGQESFASVSSNWNTQEKDWRYLEENADVFYLLFDRGEDGGLILLRMDTWRTERSGRRDHRIIEKHIIEIHSWWALSSPWNIKRVKSITHLIDLYGVSNEEGVFFLLVFLSLFVNQISKSQTDTENHPFTNTQASVTAWLIQIKLELRYSLDWLSA